VLFAILALGVGLRFWAINAGAPFRMANDEPSVVGTALGIMESGDFNPHFFYYGGLTIYLHTIVGVIWFLLGAISGDYQSLGDLWIGELLPASRAVTAAFGAMTVWVVYRVGLRIGPGTALVAALVMAVLPQPVRDAHYALTDTPLALLTALALLASLRAAEQRSLRALAVGGVVAGLAAAVKYNGGLALLMPYVAVAALPRGQRLTGLGVATGGAAAGFLAGAPYTVLDLPAFLNAFAALSQGYNQDRPFGEAAVTYVKYLRNWLSWPGVLPVQLGYAGLLVALFGGLRIARRRAAQPGATSAAIMLLFPVVCFVMLSRQGSLQYGRYLLPLAPMLAITVGAGLVGLFERTRGWARPWRRLGTVLLVGIVALPAASTVTWLRQHSWPRTEELASAWLREHVPADAPVAIEALSVLLPPDRPIVNVRRVVERTPDAYLADGVDYLVSTAAETDRYFTRDDQYAAERTAYQQLVARADVLASFAAGPTTPGSRITVFQLRR